MLRQDDAPMLRSSDAPKQRHSFASETNDVLLFMNCYGSEAALLLFPQQDLSCRQPATLTFFPFLYPIT